MYFIKLLFLLLLLNLSSNVFFQYKEKKTEKVIADQKIDNKTSNTNDFDRAKHFLQLKNGTLP